MTPRRMQALRRWEEGAVAVEAAVTLSVLLLLIFGIIEFAVAFWQWNTMLLAVDQVGRYVMVKNNPTLSPTICDTSCASTQLQNALNTTCTASTPSSGQTCVTASLSTKSSNGVNVNGMTLTATYGFDFLALAGAFTITSQTWVPLANVD